MEGAPSPEKKTDVHYFEDPDTGTLWELHPDGSRKECSMELTLEYERQCDERSMGNDPTPMDGMPLFPEHVTSKRIDDGEDADRLFSGPSPDVPPPPGPPDPPPRPDTPPPRDPKLDFGAIPLKNRTSLGRHKLDVDRGVIGMLHSENSARKEAPLMEEILHDPKLSELFGELLRTHGDEDLILIYRKEGIDAMIPSDVDTLRYRRFEFFNRLTIAEDLRAATTKEDVMFMFAKAPSLGLFRDMFPSEKSVEMIRNHIYLFAMREPENVVEATREMQRENKRVRELPEYKRMQDQILDICKKDNIPLERLDAIDDSVIKTFQHGDSHAIKKLHLDAGTRKLIRKLMYPGFWASLKGKDSVSARAAMLTTIRENLSNSTPNEGRGIADILAASMSNDPRIIRELVEEVRTGKKMNQVGEDDIKDDTKAKEQFGTQEAQVKESIRTIDAARLDRATSEAQWEYAAATGKHDVSAWDDRDREECTKIAMNSLYNDAPQLREAQARRGWFSRMLSFMYESLFSDIRAQVQDRMRTATV